jgi:hypothetical protein
MEYILVTAVEGRVPAASEPAQVERIEGAHGYSGQDASWVAEDETQIEENRIERIGTK